MTQFNTLDSPPGLDPKRLLLAVILTSVVLLAFSYFFGPKPQIPVAKDESKEIVEKNDVAKAPEVIQPKAYEQATKSDLPIEKRSFTVLEEKNTINKRTSYRAEISNQGALLDKYSLIDFSKEQVLFDKEKSGSYLLELSSNNPQSPLDKTAIYEILNADASSILLKHVTKFGLEIRRFYQFLGNATIEEQISFKNLSQTPIKVEPILSADRSEEGSKEPGILNPGVQGQSITVKTNEKYERFTYGDVKDKPKNIKNIKYVAFDDQFFLTAIVPNYNDNIEQVNINASEKDKIKTAHISLLLKPLVLVPQEEQTISHKFFVGPKQIDLLASFSTPLDENIDFGWFGVLSRPMLWLLVQIFSFVQNYGLAIIIITFIIKLLTYPLTQKSFTSQQEMKKLAPKIKELQQKYGHDRTLLGQKQMELYKTHGINPVSGCLPLLIQLPIWFAFFQMLRNSVELFDQPFYGWLTDLTRPDPYFILPILMGVSMLIQQAFTPPPTDQPHMKYVMWIMPIFLTFIMLNMPSGLSLYILTNNLLTIVQQIIIKRKAEKITA